MIYITLDKDKKEISRTESNGYIGGYECQNDGTFIKIQDDPRILVQKTPKEEEKERVIIFDPVKKNTDERMDLKIGDTRVIRGPEKITIKEFKNISTYLMCEDHTDLLTLSGVEMKGPCVLKSINKGDKMAKVIFDRGLRNIKVWYRNEYRKSPDLIFVDAFKK